MAKPGEKNISAYIDSKLSEEFKEHCDDRGIRQYKALEGAIRLWLTLTPTEQILWIQDKAKPASDDDLDEQIRQAARGFAILSEKLANRAASNSKKISRRKSV